MIISKEPAKKTVRAAATEIRSLSTTIKDNGIEAIIPEETITTVKNLGTTAKAVGAGGLKFLEEQRSLPVKIFRLYFQ